MLATVAIALVCALLVYARNLYNAERREAQAVLEEVEGIAFTIDTFHDVVEAVSRVNVSVDKHPDSHIELGGLANYQSHGQFSLGRLGKWRFVICGRRYAGAYQAATGEPVESNYSGGHIVLGPKSPYNELLPFEVHTLQDLVDHYAELVNLFETWPREAEPGTVRLADGSTQYFYVVENQ